MRCDVSDGSYPLTAQAPLDGEVPLIGIAGFIVEPIEHVDARAVGSVHSRHLVRSCGGDDDGEFAGGGGECVAVEWVGAEAGIGKREATRAVGTQLLMRRESV